MAFSGKNCTLHLGGDTIDYAVFGTGMRPMVMIPGLNLRGVKGAAAALARMYRLFAEDYTVYVIDRRAVIPAGYTVRSIAGDVARAMDALHLSNADVLGVSQGGMIAQYLALDRPELVRKLCLAVTLARPNDTVRTVIDAWVGMTERGEHDAMVRDMFERLYSEAYIQKYRPLLPVLAKLSRPKDPERFITLAKACLTCDTYDRLDEIQCPVFVIGGRQDRIVDGEASEELAQKLGCELYMYEALGHAAYEEAKDFNGRVLEFFRG